MKEHEKRYFSGYSNGAPSTRVPGARMWCAIRPAFHTGYIRLQDKHHRSLISPSGRHRPPPMDRKKMGGYSSRRFLLYLSRSGIDSTPSTDLGKLVKITRSFFTAISVNASSIPFAISPDCMLSMTSTSPPSDMRSGSIDLLPLLQDNLEDLSGVLFPHYTHSGARKSDIQASSQSSTGAFSQAMIITCLTVYPSLQG